MISLRSLFKKKKPIDKNRQEMEKLFDTLMDGAYHFNESGHKSDENCCTHTFTSPLSRVKYIRVSSVNGYVSRRMELNDDSDHLLSTVDKQFIAKFSAIIRLDISNVKLRKAVMNKTHNDKINKVIEEVNERLGI